MKPYLTTVNINNDTGLVQTQTYILTLTKLNCVKCVQGYRIDKATLDGVEVKDNKGELFLDKTTNKIAYSQSRLNFYQTAKLTFTGDLEPCGKNKWKGPAIYTEGLQGETAMLTFGFC